MFWEDDDVAEDAVAGAVGAATESPARASVIHERGEHIVTAME